MAKDMVSNVKLGGFTRKVYVIGVGATPFVNTIEDEKYKGITNGEFFGYAALMAMEDAGVEPRDIQFFYHGSANPHMMNGCVTPAIQVAEWCGLRGKGNAHHSEGCCSGYIGLEEAAFAVASGAYDLVLSGCCEMGCGIPDGNTPDHFRKLLTTDILFPDLDAIFDKAYSRFLGGGPAIHHDDWIDNYCKEYNVSLEDMDDALNNLAYHCRRAAVNTPLAIIQKPFEEEAKERGFDDVWEYLKSPLNPKMTQYLRVTSNGPGADGAAACVVCSEEKYKELVAAGKLNHPAIEVLAIGASVVDSSVPHVEKKATIEATRQVYELTGLTGDDLDLMIINDFILPSQFMAAEVAGYIPEGEGWKYARDGKISYDSDKPINPHGGRTSYGHAYGASGMADVYEAVKQMRGESGAHQIKKLPKTVFLRGFGGAQNVRCMILKTVED